MNQREIQPDQCSQLGLLLLSEMDKHKLTFTEMAEKINISRAALRIACHKNGNPGTRMIPKLAEILDCSENKINQLIRENEQLQSF